MPIVTTNQVWSFVLTSMLDEHYLSYRTERAMTRTPVIQSDITGTHIPSGIWFQNWGSYSFSDAAAQKYGNQIDLAIGRKWTMGDFKMNAALRYMDFASVGELTSPDVISVMLDMRRDYAIAADHTISPELYLEWLGCPNQLPNGTPFVQIGISHVWKTPFGLKPLTIEHRHWLAWDDGFNANKPDGLMYRIDAGFNWRITPKLEFVFPGLRFETPVIDAHDGRKTDKAVLGGIRYSF